MGKPERKAQRADSRTNLMGKFTHSVKRLVKEVADDTVPGGQSKDQVIQTNERLRMVSHKVGQSYDTAKKALINLNERYNSSKTTRNVFRRYILLKDMIKDVVRLDVQYWMLVEIPKQDKQETVPSYVLRACAALENAAADNSKTSEALKAEDEARLRERQYRFDEMNCAEIENENTLLINDLYRLLKKYLGLRTLMKELKVDYMDSKAYPIVPRYTMLKDMIKDVMRDPDYMEVCHENATTSS